MWLDLLRKAKHGDLNVIQTYVFWNIHKLVQCQYNFEENYDLVKFIKLVHEHGLYVTLRVGSFIQVEYMEPPRTSILAQRCPQPHIYTDNALYKYYMKKYMAMVVNKMREENLFSPQGGPIILAYKEMVYNYV